MSNGEQEEPKSRATNRIGCMLLVMLVIGLLVLVGFCFAGVVEDTMDFDGFN